MYKTLVAAVVLVAVYSSIASARPAFELQKEVDLKDIFLNCKKYPNKDFSVSDVTIPGCSAPPCNFVRGKTATVTFKLKAIADGPVNKTFAHVYAEMCGDIGITCATLALTKSDLCDLGATCPIKKGDENTITLSVPVSGNYPKLTITAYMYTELKEGDTDRGDSDSCFEVEVKLT